MSQQRKDLAAGIVAAQLGARSAAMVAREMRRPDLVALLERAEILIRAAEMAVDKPLPVETVAP